MSKHPQAPLPPLPQKRKPLPVDKPRINRRDWEKYINNHIRNYTKIEIRLARSKPASTPAAFTTVSKTAHD